MKKTKLPLSSISEYKQLNANAKILLYSFGGSQSQSNDTSTTGDSSHDTDSSDNNDTSTGYDSSTYSDTSVTND